jgi:hypothetical protein
MIEISDNSNSLYEKNKNGYCVWKTECEKTCYRVQMF